MIEKGQVFIRAKNKEGKWDSVDLLNPEQCSDEAFRQFVMQKLIEITDALLGFGDGRVSAIVRLKKPEEEVK